MCKHGHIMHEISSYYNYNMVTNSFLDQSMCNSDSLQMIVYLIIPKSVQLKVNALTHNAT